MWNVAENGDVGIWWIALMLDCGGERWCEIWGITLTWNAPENGDVGIWWITLVWNVVDNGDVECSRERLREIWCRTVMLGCNA